MDPSMILDFSGVCLIVALAFMGLAVWLDLPTSVNAIVIYGRETAEGILTSGDIFYPDDFDGAVLITDRKLSSIIRQFQRTGKHFEFSLVQGTTIKQIEHMDFNKLKCKFRN